LTEGGNRTATIAAIRESASSCVGEGAAPIADLEQKSF
jgi:hypothetical protein